jgi:hypothetical protein
VNSPVVTGIGVKVLTQIVKIASALVQPAQFSHPIIASETGPVAPQPG